MECNKDEAIRAMDIAKRKVTENDYSGAKTFAVKAQNLYPQLDGLKQVLMLIDVYISAGNKINGGEPDWYGVLGVDPLADDGVVKKQYRKLALLLHPDKNKCEGAEGAFKLILEAWSLLSDKVKRIAFDQKRRMMMMMKEEVKPRKSRKQKQEPKEPKQPTKKQKQPPKEPKQPVKKHPPKQPKQPGKKQKQPANQQEQPANEQEPPPKQTKQETNEQQQPPKQPKQPVNQQKQPLKQQEQPPNQQEQPPNQQEQPPNQQEQPPKQQEQPPKQQEQPPKQQEQPPKQQEQPPKQQEQPPKQPKQPANQQKQPPPNQQKQPPPNQQKQQPSPQKQQPRQPSSSGTRNGRGRSNKPTSKVSSFWTMCNKCGTRQQYVRVLFVNKNVKCRSCHVSFKATEIESTPQATKENTNGASCGRDSLSRKASSNKDEEAGRGFANSDFKEEERARKKLKTDGLCRSK